MWRRHWERSQLDWDQTKDGKSNAGFHNMEREKLIPRGPRRNAVPIPEAPRPGFFLGYGDQMPLATVRHCTLGSRTDHRQLLGEEIFEVNPAV